MNTPSTKERAAWRLLKDRKTRRVVLVSTGALIGFLCPYLPAAFEPACHASAGLARAVAALLTGLAI